MNLKSLIGVGIVAAISLFVFLRLFAGEGGKRASSLDQFVNGAILDTATFGAGCFWHAEDGFRKVEGVVITEVGFEGGTLRAPTYPDVCTDMTGHAEVVRVQYDPSKLSYQQLLEVFFDLHDPTTPNRQGLDVGTQYRSVIFYHTPLQKAQAEEFKSKLERAGRYKRPIVTEISPASTFWKAEEYHQQYYEKQRKSFKLG